MKSTSTNTSVPMKKNRHSFLSAFLLLAIVSLMISCVQLSLGPTPTPVSTATPAPTFTPTPALVDVAGSACQGKAVPGASNFSDGPDATYSIFLANMDGSPSPWNKDLPQALSAKGIADLNAVLCIGAQEPDPKWQSDCGSYKAVSGGTISLNVNRYLLDTRLVSASTGQTIFDYQVFGERPACPEDINTSDPHLVDSVLYGDDIDLQDIIDQQLPYFMPKSALIPLGTSMGTADTNWDEGALVEVSPDARLLASVPIMDQTTIQVWDVNTQKTTLTLKGHSPEIHIINDVVFSPDGKLLASSGCSSNFSCELFLWDTQSGNRLYSLLNTENETVDAGSLVFAPDGKALAAVTSGGITLWDVASGQRLQTIHLDAKGLSLLFTPDGTGLLSQDSDGNMKIWDVQSGVSRVDLGTYDPYLELAFTSDGKLLKAVIFSSQGDEKQIQLLVFDAQTGKLIEERQPLQEPKGWSTYTSYLFDADHDLLVESHYLNRDGSLRIYDLKQGYLALELFSYIGLNGSGSGFSQGHYLPVTYFWGRERYLLDISWLYHLLPENR